jgi:hypothetical protein
LIWKDEIVEEVRKARDEYAARFNYDIEAIVLDAKTKEAEGEHKLAPLKPREPAPAERG